MQSSEQHYVGGKRVRNVPIRLEGDGQSHNQRYVNVGHQRHHQDDVEMGHEQPQRHQEQRSHFHNNADPNTQHPSDPHTSTINVNYSPELNNQRQQFSPQKQQQHYATWHAQRVGRVSPPQSGQHQHQQEQPHQPQQQHQSHQPRQSDSTHDNPNKENSESLADEGNQSPNKNDSTTRGPQPGVDVPMLPDPVIPLPPPPEQPKSSQEQQQTRGQDQAKESTKAKQNNGVIQSTRAQVHQIYQEILACTETSIKSKEFLRLEEMLTVCILKLDDIQAPELRKQRKEVVQLINKCTEILEVKVKLNSNIETYEHLASSCS